MASLWHGPQDATAPVPRPEVVGLTILDADFRGTVVSAVAFRIGEVWWAQCLQHDVTAWANDLPGAYHALEGELWCTMFANVDRGRIGLQGIPPSPQVYWDMFADFTARQPMSAEPDAPQIGPP